MRKGVTCKCSFAIRQHTPSYVACVWVCVCARVSVCMRVSTHTSMCVSACARMCVSTLTHSHTLSHRQQDLESVCQHTHTHTHTTRDLEGLSEVVVCVQMGQRGPLRDDRVKAPKLLTKKNGKQRKKWGSEEALVTTASDLLFTTRSQCMGLW